MKQILIVGFMILVIAVSGCSTQKTPVQPTTPASGPSTSGNLGIKKDVEISGFAFNPSTLTIPKGATVIWTNKDSAPHTIISDSGNEIMSDSISKGETFAHTFNIPGTYSYHCSIHPSMKGTVIVE
jgi:plastocyanin